MNVLFVIALDIYNYVFIRFKNQFIYISEKTWNHDSYTTKNFVLYRKEKDFF